MSGGQPIAQAERPDHKPLRLPLISLEVPGDCTVVPRGQAGVAVHEIHRPRNEHAAVRPSRRPGEVVNIGRDHRKGPVRKAGIDQVSHPFRQEGGSILLVERAGDHLVIVGPAHPFVALRAVRRQVDKIRPDRAAFVRRRPRHDRIGALEIPVSGRAEPTMIPVKFPGPAVSGRPSTSTYWNP